MSCCKDRGWGAGGKGWCSVIAVPDPGVVLDPEVSPLLSLITPRATYGPTNIFPSCLIELVLLLTTKEP